MAIIFEPATGVTITTGANTGKHSPWFRDFLFTKGVTVGSASPFGRSLAYLDQFTKMIEAGGPPPLSMNEMFELATHAIGADFMMKSIHRTISQTAEPFGSFWPEFATADAVQTRPGKDSFGRNRLWELLTAALVANYATNVEANEPDVHCTYLDRRWGIACKAFYSDDRDRQVDAIVEGAKQLERSAVDRGVVAVNVANVFAHFDVFRANFPDARFALDLVQRTMAEYLTTSFGKLLGDSRLAVGKNGTRDKTRCVIFFCPTIVNVDHRPSLYCNVTPLMFRRVCHEEDRFVRSLLKAAATAIDDPAPAGG